MIDDEDPNSETQFGADTGFDADAEFGAEDGSFDGMNAAGGFAMPSGFGGEMEAGPAEDAKPDLNLIMDIPVTMQVVLGSAVMPVANLVKLGRGAVVKLDTSIGDPVDLIVNGRIVARGEVVVLENEESRFGITLTEIVSPGSRPKGAKSLHS